MSSQRITSLRSDDRPPWSPLSVSLIAFLLPAGGAILTIRNLHRLKQINDIDARRLIVTVSGVCIIGYVLMFSFVPHGAKFLQQPDSNAAALLSCGIALASYAVQRLPFRSWRSENARTKTSAWLPGIGLAALYQFGTLIATVLLVLIASGFGLIPPLSS
ncbi:MAG: hypothetical protein NVSMB52_16830 [Chloroflexota bacterium]